MNSLKNMRGVKILLPPPDQIEELFRFLDIAVHYGANALMIELGGAMEYKRHPEINEGWLEYAAFMGEYSGKGQKIQEETPWRRNSIHSDNGGGRVLTQDQIRTIADYARKLGMEIIPEVPCLSHCDYLLTRHRDLAERAEDPYPDTFCPSNPKSYELLFDVLEETIELFHPRVINIGHDEFYSFGLCPKCKGKPAPELYANDIRKIHDFLAEHHVETMIWAEKLLDAHFIDSHTPCGGAEAKDLPATYPAIDLVPRDLLLLHWYWSIDRRLEEEFKKRGFRFAFGNFTGRSIPEWKRRSSAKGFFGCMISNWGRSDLPTLQRNCLLADLAFGALLDRVDNPDENREMLWEQAFRSLFDLRYGDHKKRLYIRHSTSLFKPYQYLVDGRVIDKEADSLGSYVITLKDGREIKAPVLYGFNISCSKQAWFPPRPRNEDLYSGMNEISETTYTTLPVRIGDHTEYVFGVDLPANGEVASCVFQPAPGHEEETVAFKMLGTFLEPPSSDEAKRP